MNELITSTYCMDGRMNLPSLYSPKGVGNANSLFTKISVIAVHP